MGTHSILPALLDATEGGLEIKLRLVRPWNTPIHLDVVDGIFAKPTSAKGVGLRSVPAHSVVHLMVHDPVNYFPWAQETGFETIIAHIEGNPVLPTTQACPKGMKIFAAIKEGTALPQIEPWIPYINGIHIMMGPLGTYGSAFQPAMLDRVSEAHHRWPELPISCDVGLNPKTIPQVFAAGASMAVVGSFLFKSKNPDEQWAKLGELLKKL